MIYEEDKFEEDKLCYLNFISRKKNMENQFANLMQKIAVN